MLLQNVLHTLTSSSPRTGEVHQLNRRNAVWFMLHNRMMMFTPAESFLSVKSRQNFTPTTFPKKEKKIPIQRRTRDGTDPIEVIEWNVIESFPRIFLSSSQSWFVIFAGGRRRKEDKTEFLSRVKSCCLAVARECCWEERNRANARMSRRLLQGKQITLIFLLNLSQWFFIDSNLLVKGGEASLLNCERNRRFGIHSIFAAPAATWFD